MRTQRIALRTRILAGERVCGVLLRMPSEELVEMLAVAGFDFILIDCEHGPADVAALRQHIAAAAMHGADVLVRVGEGEDALILRALDSGAAGVVVPHLDSLEQARDVVAAAHYPRAGAGASRPTAAPGPTAPSAARTIRPASPRKPW